MSNDTKKTYAIRLDDKMIEKIDKIAEKKERNRSNMIRFIIKSYLESVDL